MAKKRTRSGDAAGPKHGEQRSGPIAGTALVSGVAISSSMLPRSRSRTIATPVNSTIVIVRITPMSPGTMLIAERRCGL